MGVDVSAEKLTYAQWSTTIVKRVDTNSFGGPWSKVVLFLLRGFYSVNPKWMLAGECVMKWMYPYTFVSTLGSYETGHHKSPIIIQVLPVNSTAGCPPGRTCDAEAARRSPILHLDPWTLCPWPFPASAVTRWNGDPAGCVSRPEESETPDCTCQQIFVKCLPGCSNPAWSHLLVLNDSIIMCTNDVSLGKVKIYNPYKE